MHHREPCILCMVWVIRLDASEWPSCSLLSLLYCELPAESQSDVRGVTSQRCEISICDVTYTADASLVCWTIVWIFWLVQKNNFNTICFFIDRLCYLPVHYNTTVFDYLTIPVNITQLWHNWQNFLNLHSGLAILFKTTKADTSNYSNHERRAIMHKLWRWNIHSWADVKLWHQTSTEVRIQRQHDYIFLPSVLRHWWLDVMSSIQSVKI